MSYAFDTLARAWQVLQGHLPAEHKDGPLAHRFGAMLEELHEADHRLRGAINRDDGVTSYARRLDSLMNEHEDDEPEGGDAAARPEDVYVVTTHLAVAVPEGELHVDAYLADAVNEILRDQQRSFVPTSCLLDYSVGSGEKKTVTAENYAEGDAFAAPPKDEPEDDGTRYKVVRHRFKGENTVVKTGLTLAQAQEHCQREDTHGEGWFDGYTEE